MAALGTCIGSFTPPALPYGTMCRTIVGGSPPGLVETLMSNATNSYRLSLHCWYVGPALVCRLLLCWFPLGFDSFLKFVFGICGRIEVVRIIHEADGVLLWISASRRNCGTTSKTHILT